MALRSRAGTAIRPTETTDPTMRHKLSSIAVLACVALAFVPGALASRGASRGHANLLGAARAVRHYEARGTTSFHNTQAFCTHGRGNRYICLARVCDAWFTAGSAVIGSTWAAGHDLAILRPNGQFRVEGGGDWTVTNTSCAMWAPSVPLDPSRWSRSPLTPIRQLARWTGS